MRLVVRARSGSRVKSLAQHFAFLDALRESGATNMWGAHPYLRVAHGLDEREARAVCGRWMDTFDGISTPEERAAVAAADREAGAPRQVES